MARGTEIDVRLNQRALREMERTLSAFPIEAAIAAQQAANSTSNLAKKYAQKAVDDFVDEPEDLTRDAIFARQRRLGSVSKPRDATAEIGIRSMQSRWLGYHLGDDQNFREPGEQGPADKHVMIPIKTNLESRAAKTAGASVRLTKGGNMPPGTLNKLFSMTGPGGALWWGKVRTGSALGLWLRPQREGKRNLGAPKLLIAAKPRVVYQPNLQAPLDRAVAKAARTFPARIRAAMRRLGRRP